MYAPLFSQWQFFGADLDRAAGGSLHGGIDIDIRHAGDNAAAVCLFAFKLFLDGVYKLGCLRGGLVHLPVARDDSLSVLFVHNKTSFV